MCRRRRAAAAALPLAAVALAGAVPALPLAFPQGAAPGYTGGFGEPHCGQCHFADGAGVEDGAVAVEGVPGAYTPGAVYRLTVRVEDAGMRAAGFQLAARFAEGPGAAAGTLQAGGSGVRVERSAGVPYAGHDAPRPAEDGAAAWTVEWTAPPPPAGPVVFHAAALAADGDGSQFGDRVHTVEVTARVRRDFK